MSRTFQRQASALLRALLRILHLLSVLAASVADMLAVGERSPRPGSRWRAQGRSAPIEIGPARWLRGVG